MFDKLVKNWRSVLLALGVHLLAAVLLIFGVQFVTSSSSRGNHGERIVKASVVNPESVDTSMSEPVSPTANEEKPETPENKPEPEPEPDAQKQAEEKRQAEQAAKAKAQAEAEAEQKAKAEAARKKAEAEQKAKAEAARKKAEAEQKAKAEAARKKAEAEQKAAAEAEAKRKAQAKAEAKRKAAEKAAREKAKAERKAQAEAARKAKEKAEREAEARRQAKAEAARKAREEAARKAREEAQRKAAAEKRAREAALREAMAEESIGRQNAANSQQRSAYTQAIQDKVESNWLRPPGARDISCKVRVKQLPGGQIVGVQLLDSCGSAAVDRSVEQAIRKSDPLPKAPSDSVFDSEITFNFEPDQ